MKFTILSCSRPSQRRRGAALVEFALVAVIFFSMLLGMLQFGIYQSAASTLWTMSREGARVAAVQTAGSVDANQKIYDRVLAAAPPNIDKTDYGTSDNGRTGGNTKLFINIIPKEASARTSGSTVRVEIEYDLTDKMIVPMASLFFAPDLRRNGKVFYRTATTMRVE